MPLERIDNHFLALAKQHGERSTLSHSKRGAVLAKGNQILSIGVNSHLDPAGEGHANDNERYVATVNAEMVAIGSAIQAGLSLVGATMYSSEEPFWITFKLLITIGIKRVVYYGPSKNNKIRDYSQRMGVEVIVIG